MITYYKHKAQEIEDKIHSERVNSNWKITGEQTTKIIEIGLKEVARDIRHQLIEDLYNKLSEFDPTLDFKISQIENVIMNFEPKIRVKEYKIK